MSRRFSNRFSNSEKPSAVQIKTHSRSGVEKPIAKSPVRHLLEAIVLLALAVTLFRTFALEGFMISTGSMAPTLRGYHYRIVCPDCQFHFAWTATEKNPRFPVRRLGNDVKNSTADSSAKNDPKIVCPNCHYEHINSQNLTINEGDQLLVDKLAFEWHAPARWDPVVFRNPQRPTQAFAKRIIGLPGETISLNQGDIYLKGEIQRKSLSQQRQVRILVSDSHFKPQFQDDNYRDCWEIAESTSVDRKMVDHKIPEGKISAWQVQGNGYDYQPLAEQASSESELKPVVDWLVFRHWIRSGGNLRYTIPLNRWPSDVALPTENAPLHYDEVKKVLSCRGALDAELMQKLKDLSTDVVFRSAIEELFKKSHLRPLTDQLAYNQTAENRSHNIRDLMIELNVKPLSQQSQLVLCMDDGEYQFFCRFNFASRTVDLATAKNTKPLRKGALPNVQFEKPIKVEMSIMDRQVLVAVNDKLVFEPYAYRFTAAKQMEKLPESRKPNAEAKQSTQKVPLRPIRIGTVNAPLQLSRIRVYRDLYYRNSEPQQKEYKLQDDELFMLGDNSEVSVDSREWAAGSVKTNLVIGRPLILHLPSQKKKIELGPFSTQIRVPDSKRVRLLR